MNSVFIESLDLRDHPIKKAKKRIRAEYFSALTYIVNQVVHDPEDMQYVHERMKLYKNILLLDTTAGTSAQNNGLEAVNSCIGKPRRKKFRYMLVCDVALILLDDALTMQAISIVNKCLSERNQADVGHVVSALYTKNEIDKKHFVAAPLITQYRLNKQFMSQQERRIIVTANMSAGKSTLINALIGKPLARTSQEVCTGNICYLFNKAFEDDNVHLSTKALTMNATADELHSYEWSGPVSIASHFAQSTPEIPKLCIIDTPGVDAALYRNHTNITHTALRNEEYDMVIYVVCPTNLGSNAEIKHIKWVSQNIPKDKVIFVLNKLDNYRDCSDSVEESVKGLRDDLLKNGFENPTICPISAYFSYLLKLKMTGQKLSDDEADEYAFLSKKFMRSSYDLSRFYSDNQSVESETEEMKLCKRAGMYGLEKIIYGD